MNRENIMGYSGVTFISSEGKNRQEATKEKGWGGKQYLLKQPSKHEPAGVKKTGLNSRQNPIQFISLDANLNYFYFIIVIELASWNGCEAVGKVGGWWGCRSYV